MAIGERLREARMRQRIDVSEVERVTKIRAKYLRALENEEFDLLPGPTFVKSFLKTYSDYLGLDSRLLVEEYRERHEPREEEEPPAPFTPRPPRRRERLRERGGIGGGGESRGGGAGQQAKGGAGAKGHNRGSRRQGSGRLHSVSLRIVPAEPTYVCLDTGPGTQPIFNGDITDARTWRAKRLRLNLGKPSATVKVNGHTVDTGGGANPVGFAFVPNGRAR